MEQTLQLLNRPGWEAAYEFALRLSAAGAQAQPPRLLLVGEPGTGKTTVTPLLAQVMQRSGILARTDMEVITPLELSSRFGDIRRILTDAADRAEGGTLLLDNGFLLLDRPELQQQVLRTLTELSCDPERRFCLMLTGYPDRAAIPEQLDPGFARKLVTLQLQPLNEDQLYDLFAQQLAEEGLAIEADCEALLREFFRRQSQNGSAFGSARCALLPAQQCIAHHFRNESAGPVLRAEDLPPRLRGEKEKGLIPSSLEFLKKITEETES